jgi:hypothetical protein
VRQVSSIEITRWISSVTKPIAAGLRIPGSGCHIEQLAHHALDAQPLDRVAAPGVDNQQPAARLGAARGKRTVERQALEGAVLARERQPDDGIGADEGEPGRISVKNLPTFYLADTAI